ncbi:MAG: hypothetical protein GYA36_01255 [Veillonellaceae bacterium]|nr:hypothetical protein [Veillonellaceae bacterium]
MHEMNELIRQYQDCLARVREQAARCDSASLREQMTLLLSIACAIYRESVLARNEALIAGARSMMQNTTAIMLNMGEMLSNQQLDLPTAAAGILSAFEVVNPARRYN